MEWRINFRKKKGPRACKCNHPQLTHYSPDGHCVYPKCTCQAFKPKGNIKYNSERGRCQLEHAHDSGLEIKTCFDLQCLQRAGEIESFKPHKVLDLKGSSGATVATYEIDFVVEHPGGITEFIECKGDHLIREPAWRLKWALLQDQYKEDPKIRFRVIRG